MGEIPNATEWYYKVEPYFRTWPWRWKVTLYHNQEFVTSEFAIFEFNIPNIVYRLKKREQKRLRRGKGYVGYL